MISKAEILKMARSILKGEQGAMQHPVVEPRREWFIGIGFFFVVFIAGGVFTAQKYKYYSNIESTVETATKTHKKYDQNSAEFALRIFKERHEKFNAVVSVPVPEEYNTQASSTETGTSTEAILMENENEPAGTSATSSSSAVE